MQRASPSTVHLPFALSNELRYSTICATRVYLLFHDSRRPINITIPIICGKLAFAHTCKTFPDEARMDWTRPTSCIFLSHVFRSNSRHLPTQDLPRGTGGKKMLRIALRRAWEKAAACASMLYACCATNCCNPSLGMSGGFRQCISALSGSLGQTCGGLVSTAKVCMDGDGRDRSLPARARCVLRSYRRPLSRRKLGDTNNATLHASHAVLP